MLKKKLWRMCTNFWINPHNGKLPSRLAPAQYQNSLTPQLLSNIYWSKTKTSISLNRVYWYDTMCHIFSCYNKWLWSEKSVRQFMHIQCYLLTFNRGSQYLRCWRGKNYGKWLCTYMQILRTGIIRAITERTGIFKATKRHKRNTSDVQSRLFLLF